MQSSTVETDKFRRSIGRFSLADHLVKSRTFDDEVNALVEKYSRVCSEGTRQAKMLLKMSFDMPHGQFFDEYLRRQRIALASPDHQEAMAAYREKREPVFQLEAAASISGAVL